MVAVRRWIHTVGLVVAWLAHGTGALWMRGPSTSALDHLAILVPGTLLLTCGTIIVSRTNVRLIGWLLVLPGAMLAWIAALEVISFRTVSRWPDLLFTLLTPLSFLPIVLLVLLFPTGRFADRWMRILGALVCVALVGRAVADLRTWLESARMLDPSATFTFTVRVVIVAVALGLVAQAVAYRRRSPVEQRQMKWFLLASFSVVVYAPAVVLDLQGSALRYADAISSSLWPIAILFAITRRGLYEIDRILTRAVTYAVVVAILAGMYLVGITVLSTALPGADAPVVALTTLTTVLLFDPLRRSVHERVARRFDRTRYAAEEVVRDFGRELREVMRPDDISARVEAVVSDTVAPTTVAVWQPTRGARATDDTSGLGASGDLTGGSPEGEGSVVRRPSSVPRGVTHTRSDVIRTPTS